MKFPFFKPTIVILHGWNLSGERFLPLTNEFKKLGYKVFAPDLPGFGEEKAPETPWHIKDYADFLQGYFRKKHIKNPILVGHSFGGRVSLKYQQLYPKNVRAIILSGTPGFSPVPKKKMFIFFVLSKIGKIIFSIPPLTLLSDVARRYLYYVAGTKEFFHAEGSMRQTFKHIVTDDLVSSMESMQAPCLLLWGEYDVIVPVSIAKRMQEVIPSATLKVIPEADHGVPFKQPDIFSSYVEGFLKTL